MGLVEKIVSAWWGLIKKSDDKRLALKQPISEISETTNLFYRNDNEVFHTLDIYRHEKAVGKLPVIFDIHGGGWAYGDKELNKYFCQGLCLRGFAVVNLSYHLIPTKCMPEPMEDILHALNFIVENADKYCLDVNNIFLTGDSAGAHFVALAIKILNDVKLQSIFKVKCIAKINAIGLTCGVYNLADLLTVGKGLGKKYLALLFGKEKGFENSQLFKACCIVDDDILSFPPTFINTSNNDFFEKYNLAFFDLLKKNNIECELVDFIDGQTEHKLQHVYNICFPEWNESMEANDKMCAFFKAHIV
ncbi:MAG: alpha/beta hydrolase [Clostridia bacterium]